MTYEKFYARISAPFGRNDRRKRILKTADRFLTCIFYLIYPIFLLVLFLRKDGHLVSSVIIPAVSFVFCTFLRAGLNFPRPYEKADIQPLIHKNTHGKSFPSRHVFCATLIAVTVLRMYPVAGVFLLFLSLLEGVIRVIGGVHFPRDVLFGFLLAILIGLVYLYI